MKCKYKIITINNNELKFYGTLKKAIRYADHNGIYDCGGLNILLGDEVVARQHWCEKTDESGEYWESMGWTICEGYEYLYCF